ncbi:MAG: YkgJ family cysteine cluster protein, partial [Acidobacteria bacterium]|nr:YkgJ family cysteine cluster protein [Acidobacteriota bacterium]
MRVRALSVHAGYACAQSGACCRAGWTIPVDRATRRRIDAHLAAGELDAPAVAPCFATYEADGGESIAFGHDHAGTCAFLARDGSEACTIHAALGEEALPMTCRQFPRVAVVGDGWTDVSLSHFCPTAAAHLVDATTPLTIIDDPAC